MAGGFLSDEAEDCCLSLVGPAVMAASCGTEPSELTVGWREQPPPPLPVVTAATTEAALALAGITGLVLASAIW